MKTKDYGHSIFYYIAMLFMFITLLFMYGGLFYDFISEILPFIDYGGVFKWKTVQIGNAEFSLYWSAYIVGVVLLCTVRARQKDIYGLSLSKVIAACILFVLISFAGAKLLYILQNFTAVSEGKIELGFGGVSLFGAIFHTISQSDFGKSVWNGCEDLS